MTGFDRLNQQAAPQTAVKGLAAIVGFLVMVEFASGILQGYYTPIYPQIAEHLSIHEGDINWFEAAQLIVSALCIPLLARLGDLVGHKRVLLISTAVTALGLVVAGLRARASRPSSSAGRSRVRTSSGSRSRSRSSTGAPGPPDARSC